MAALVMVQGKFVLRLLMGSQRKSCQRLQQGAWGGCQGASCRVVALCKGICEHTWLDLVFSWVLGSSAWSYSSQQGRSQRLSKTLF